MSAPARPQIKVGILGATGTVGQRFIELLAAHPYFSIHALGASSRSAGQQYAKIVRWKLATPIPDSVRHMVVQECKPDAPGFAECGVVFSGLDADVAGDIENAFRAADLVVYSNAKNYRRDPLCPLIVPLVNPSHLSIIPHQREQLGLKKGYIVTNANCSTTGIVVPLAALEKAFGPLETVMVTTLQAISGAGYPGVSSLDVMDNVVPLISGEEDKIEWETNKILGGVTPDNKAFDLHAPKQINVSATCTRVPVIDGHTGCVSVKFARSPAPSVAEVEKAFREYTCEAQELGVPSAPGQAIVVHDAPDRPQPRLDKNLYNGACVSVGRIRECPVFDVKFVCLIDNVRLGAATSSVINAEIAVEKGLIQ
ncbi:aspartate-semialdehyde dehydrogenase [Cryptococcus neoformans Tu401-1]|nr:aspartate-semialdehyde dehydrogenase [Cryptococcus neoformans var. grubii Bt1]OWZ58968.1 aspartate-semialdehyde dehydrogenase [Cryptococcus neoformans var. grubii AD1-83a]OXG24717.1 aspartate-semialdehyde dehydrogenase [Cryptococcus neoformans var. grubii Tu401-1]OXG36726.1 aspartate-semialdehyde dehydrogenase [Cryptococcus neoformans var. grubii Ze90-1]OXG54900.1 aspartate-semialdehyde dehydrogenase [Cryptococcus neoformans var. grubii Th84]OXG69494.1 aspartate-semialdehyde dehydrogenase [